MLRRPTVWVYENKFISDYKNCVLCINCSLKLSFELLVFKLFFWITENPKNISS